MTELEVVTIGELLGVVEPLDLRTRLESTVLLQKSIGGAEVNVALTLARLGHRVGWAGALGDDPFGRQGIRTLRGENVDVSQVVVDTSAPRALISRSCFRSESCTTTPTGQGPRPVSPPGTTSTSTTCCLAGFSI